MMNLEEIKVALEDKNISKVARRCGMHPNTLRRLLAGGKVTTLTIKSVSVYLKNEAEKVLSDVQS